MKLMRCIAAMTSALIGCAAIAGQTPSPWDQPTLALAEQIAGVLGPGQARMTVRNLSTILPEEVVAVSRLLELDLKAHGVVTSDAESANTIRVTLSEAARRRLWVAEIVEGSQARVVMVELPASGLSRSVAASGLTLRKQTLLTSRDQILAAVEIGNTLVAVEPEAIVVFGHGPDGLTEQKRMNMGQRHSFSRDPRAVILPETSGSGVEVRLGGVVCTASSATNQTTEDGRVHCRDEDDPWPIVEGMVGRDLISTTPNQGDEGQLGTRGGAPAIKAFYNAARNYFTGVVSPGVGVDLPAFYSAALLPRAGTGAALLVGGVDGKVQLAENGTLKTVSGVRDWGSDFAALQSGCGAGTQIVASGSGEAISDSLRAYAVPSMEAVPASAPLTMDGTVTALWSAPDGKGVFAVVRSVADEYEVDRVTALCY